MKLSIAVALLLLCSSAADASQLRGRALQEVDSCNNECTAADRACIQGLCIHHDIICDRACPAGEVCTVVGGDPMCMKKSDAEICADTVCDETAHCVVLLGKPRCVNSEVFSTSTTTTQEVADPAAAADPADMSEPEVAVAAAVTTTAAVEDDAAPEEAAVAVTTTAVEEPEVGIVSTTAVEDDPEGPTPVLLADLPEVEPVAIEEVILDATPPATTGEGGEMVDEPVPIEQVLPEDNPILDSTPPETPPLPELVAEVDPIPEPIGLEDVPPPTTCAAVLCLREEPCQVIDGVAQCVKLDPDEIPELPQNDPDNVPPSPPPVDPEDEPIALPLELPEEPPQVELIEPVVVDPIDDLINVPPPTTCAVVTCLDTQGCEVIDGVAQCVPAPIILDSEILPEVITSIEDLDTVVEELVGCALVQCEAPAMCQEVGSLFECVEPPTTVTTTTDLDALVSGGSCEIMSCILPAVCQVVDGVAGCVIPADELETMVEDQEQQMMTAQPDWWPRVSANYAGDARLKSCGLRNGVPPVPGTNCAKRPKTCFFGSQGCGDEIGPHPTRRCHCPGGPIGNRGKWVCEDLTCPASATEPVA